MTREVAINKKFIDRLNKIWEAGVFPINISYGKIYHDMVLMNWNFDEKDEHFANDLLELATR
jgi:hypothetical protein